jgi:hypothetical protein
MSHTNGLENWDAHLEEHEVVVVLRYTVTYRHTFPNPTRHRKPGPSAHRKTWSSAGIDSLRV